MVTGYTSNLFENDLNFSDFALLCCRALGVTASMRDLPFSAPIPPKFACSVYHEDRLKEAEETLSTLDRMTPEERRKYGTEKRMYEINRYEEAIEEAYKREKVLEDMKKRVAAWEPPTSNHESLKEFMTNQLEMSSSDLDFHKEHLRKSKSKSGMDYFYEHLNSAKRSISYHKEKFEEDITRNNRNNKWMSDLRESLE